MSSLYEKEFASIMNNIDYKLSCFLNLTLRTRIEFSLIASKSMKQSPFSEA